MLEEAPGIIAVTASSALPIASSIASRVTRLGLAQQRLELGERFLYGA
jgi:hypothetical protein